LLPEPKYPALPSPKPLSRTSNIAPNPITTYSMPISII
jgi:hypothetical protein